jgi:DNA polymerase I-like protein with 3'-5' exonuclease and polymerase domains
MSFALEPALSRVSRTRGRALPCVPQNNWKPGVFADLSGAKMLAIDLETYDPNLMEKGPGWARHDGHIVGFSVGTDDGFRGYYPIRHAVDGHHNLPAEKALAWLSDTLATSTPKIGANIGYDVGWLAEEGVSVAGELIDVQFAEALLTEDSSTALETLGKKYCDEGKQSHTLYEWCAAAYGGEANGGQRDRIWRAPPALVGPYAESDVDLPLRVFAKQWPALCAQNLQDVFRMECGLIPMFIAMRMQGVRVDISAAEQLHADLVRDEQEAQKRLEHLAGRRCNVNVKEDLVAVFKAHGLSYAMTKPSKQFPEGQPSLTKGFLANAKHPIGNAIMDVRRFEKLRTTFVEGYILNAHVNGRVHGQFHSMRRSDSDDEAGGGGTRSGRIASSSPNLQNLPSRDEKDALVKYAKQVRGIFRPFEGHKEWLKIDYSQIEYRAFVHYAQGVGADDARLKYITDPRTDFHEWTLDVVAPFTGWDLEAKGARADMRKKIKTINFGLLYGMGKAKLAASLGLSDEAAEALFEAYHRGVPFVHPTARHYSQHADRYGEVTTILGRKSRFEEFELDWKQLTHAERAEWSSRPPIDLAPRSRVEAMKHFPAFRRAHTHKALNRVLQGSAADLMKKAMLDLWNSGVFKTTGVPMLTVHDELDFSVPPGTEEAFLFVKHTMEHAIPFRVPIRAEVETGPDWGHTKAA